jgi:hypothetical protein
MNRLATLSVHVLRVLSSWLLPWTLALGVPAPAAAEEPAEVRLTVFDQLARPDETVVLRAKLEHRGKAGANPDLRGYVLKFHSPSLIDRETKTGADGMATVEVKPPAGTKSPVAFTVAFAGSPHHKPAAAQGRLFVWAADRRLLVSDIDNTISDLAEVKVPFTDNQNIPPLPGAVETLKELSRTQGIVYLTARDDALYPKTRAWLQLKGFPDGPVFCRDFSLLESQEGFKRRFLQTLKNRYRHLIAGVGDKPGDARAYLHAGMKAYLIDPLGEAPVVPGAVMVKTWHDVQRNLAKE